MPTNPHPEAEHGGRCELGGMPRLSALPAKALEKLGEIGRSHRFEAGQTVWPSGENQEFIGYVQHGFLCRQKTLEDGRQHIVGLLVDGDIFGRLFDGSSSYAIEALTKARICAFARAPFVALLSQYRELERMVAHEILNELDRAQDWIMIMSNQKVSQRLAGFLLFLASRFAVANHQKPTGGVAELRIPISRPDLSRLLGTRPETISRAFHALADVNSIAICKPDLIQILDIEALARAAGDRELARGLAR